jgi:hypothetical protein
MTTDWILRAANGENLIRSSKYKMWGINTTNSCGKYFIKHVKPGDRLWFVQSKSHGKLLAVATYRSQNKRDLGPLIDVSMSNEELGWTTAPIHGSTDWDTEIHYTDLYNLSECDLLTHIKGAVTIRKYDEKCRVDLPVEYSYIVRYSKVTFEL